MNAGKSFSYLFEDRNWVLKIVIAAAILLMGVFFFWVALIPTILAFALLAGYGLEITRRVIRGNPLVLPEWEDWGTLLVDGLKVCAILLVYALPSLVISACVGMPMSLFMENRGGSLGVGEAYSGLVGLFNLAWGIVTAVLVPAAVASFADSGDLAHAFRFGEVVALVRKNLGTYVVTALMTWVAGVIAWLGVCCLVGWLATVPYYVIVASHLYGQAYLVARRRSEAPSDSA